VDVFGFWGFILWIFLSCSGLLSLCRS